MKINNNIVFLGFDYDYEKLDIESLKKYYNIKHVVLSKKFKFIYYKVKFLNRILIHLTSIFIKYKLSGIENQDLIIFKDDEFYLDIGRKLENTNKIVVVRNILNDHVFSKFNNFKSVYSFDKRDVDKYNLKYYHQFTPAYSIMTKYINLSDVDVSFIGLDKGRSNIINSIIKDYPELKYRIKIVKNKGKFFNKEKSIKYLDFLDIQYNTKAVLDIVQEGQSGVTMRFIESLRAHKKIITNNFEIRKHSLYSQSYVYIINHDDRSLYEFLDSPITYSVDDKVEDYSSLSVWRKIINNEI